MGNQVVVIKNVELVTDLNFEIRQPGKVWKLTTTGEPVVICGQGMIKIKEAEVIGSCSLIPMKKLRVRFS